MAGGRLKAIGYDNPVLPFYMAVGLGMVPGCTRVTALGHNPNIGSGAAADVWEGGGDYPFLATAATLEVLSGSAADTAAGTGARTVLVSGLDANYNPVSETVALNGVTPVATVRQYLRVNVFTTTTSSGSGKKNAGDLTLRVSGGGTTLSIARAGDGFGRSGVFSVQAGFTLFILSEVFTVKSPGGANVNAAVFGTQLISPNGNSRIPLQFQVTSQVPYRHEAAEGIVLTERSDVTLRVATTSQASTDVTSAFEGVLIDNLLLS